MPDRNYNQSEINILKGFYGGDNSNWSGFTLKPNDNRLIWQHTVVTGETGDIYYAGDWRYSGDYSALTFSDYNSAREIHTFIHEGWHQVQSMYTSELAYLKMVGGDAAEHNYNYEIAFTGTPFYKLSSEQQAEFFADYYLLKNGGSAYVKLSKSGGDVGSHTVAEYDTVYLSAKSEGLSSLVTKTVEFDNQQDHKNRYNGDEGGHAMPAGADDDGATVDAEHIEDIGQEFGISMTRGSPLVLDIDGDGVELVSLYSSSAVYFDVDSAKNDGMAEATGWFSGGDGALCLDINQDGIINNSSELFGDQTGYINGFEALRAYDSNGDNQISSQDTIWSTLRVWIEDVVDGVSEAQEIHTLEELSITSINLGYSNVNYTLNDNVISQESSFSINGNVHDIVDAYFTYSNLNTINNTPYDFDYVVIGLPDVRGYGNISDLQISMLRDSTGTGNLLDMVAALEAKTFAQIFDGTTTLKDDVRDILFKWAGVDAVNPNGRGSFIDGQEIAFLEQLMGQEFLQQGISSKPYGSEAGNDLKEAFVLAFDNFYARLVAQSAGGELFTGEWSYDMVSDSFTGITGLDTDKLDALEAEATALATTAERLTFWGDVVRMVEYSLGTDNLSTAALSSLEGAITGSDATLDLQDDILPALVFTRPTGVDEEGTSGDDIMNGSSGDDLLEGYSGNDTLYGLTGNDDLYGNNGDDTLVGGTGGDYLHGGLGNDTYVYNVGDGEDTIVEQGSGSGNDQDTIQFGVGITLTDLTFERLGSFALLIKIGGATPGQIIIEGQFSPTGTAVEKLIFSDSSVYTLTDKAYTTYGTSQNDTVEGTTSAGLDTDTIYLYDGDDKAYGDDGDDVIYGGNGNDTLYGENGNDILDGGAGSDTLIGGYGNDTYVYEGGHDIIYEGNQANSTDEILMAAGITAGDLTFARINQNDLLITVDGLGSITIEDQFYSAGDDYVIETIRFSDDSTINLLTKEYVATGTSGDDFFNGIVYGGSVNDTMYLYDGDDAVNAGNGDDVIYSGSGNDDIEGGNGNDTLYGDDGNDLLYGDAGDDTLDGGTGDDALMGGSGNDTYVYESGYDVIYEGSQTNNSDEILMAAGITANDLTFIRSSHDDLLITVDGLGSITIEDQFYNSSGSYAVESIRFSDNSTINLLTKQYVSFGTSGYDSWNGITGGGSINDIMYMNDGNDYVSAGNGTDVVYGGNGNDTLYGDAGNDILYGESGNDILHGGYDNDILDGGAGDDILYGLAGNDTYVYTSGNDFFSDGIGSVYSIDEILMPTGITESDLTFTRVSAYDLLINVAGLGTITVEDQFYGTNGAYAIESIRFSDDSTVNLFTKEYVTQGTSGSDSWDGIMGGGSTNDTMYMNDGNDSVYAGNGDDIVYGGNGDDTLRGENGNDILSGQDGLDTLYGGSGADTFVFEAASAFNNIDVISDFSLSQNDKIDISDVLYDYDPLTDAITDFLEITTSGSNSIVKVDLDGTGTSHTLQQIATISWVTGLTDEQSLVSNGNLIV
ncbi:MAG: calcium-binding protein [Alphaproteobacteria bacterium]|nr:calcium-binding protein [Alphaproteobacteria bacterium]